MHTKAELYGLKKNPRINEISLKILQEYYEAYLLPNTYKVFIGDTEYISVRFPAEAFCHLLGIETIVKKAVNKRNIQNYKGHKGFENVKNLKITFDTLRKLNKKAFMSVKDKFVFFYLIPQVFNGNNAVIYNESGASSNLLSDIIFYENFLKAYVHIGVVKIGNDEYAPRTFFIERVTASNDGLKFISGQTELEVKKIAICRARHASPPSRHCGPSPIGTNLAIFAAPLIRRCGPD